MLVGLLPVDPTRLHLYWEGERGNLAFRLRSEGALVLERRDLSRKGNCYLDGLRPGARYRADFYLDGRLRARSNVVELPPAGAQPTPPPPASP